MRGVGVVRVVVGVVGLAAGAYGVLLLLQRPLADLVDGGLWLAGGVVAHDLVLAPVVLALAALVVPRLPEVSRAPVAMGGVVLGAVTLVAVPVLGQFGASPGNPTLLDRDYVAGWFVLAGLIAVGVVGAILYRRMRTPDHDPPHPERSADGPGAGG